MAATYSFDLKMKMTDKENHRLSNFLQPALDLRRCARFLQQSIKFEELEKKEKVSVEEVQNLVEKALIDSNYKNIQKAGV